MAVVLRLARAGATKRPFYHVVAADSRMPRDGRFIENIGTYDPNFEPVKFQVNEERWTHWVGTGAKPSDTVAELYKKTKKAAPKADGKA
jgi:small subunit ribosomal protein S16